MHPAAAWAAARARTARGRASASRAKCSGGRCRAWVRWGGSSGHPIYGPVGRQRQAGSSVVDRHFFSLTPPALQCSAIIAVRRIRPPDPALTGTTPPEPAPQRCVQHSQPRGRWWRAGGPSGGFSMRDNSCRGTQRRTPALPAAKPFAMRWLVHQHAWPACGPS